MLAEIWTGLGEGIAQRVTTLVLSPALAFWLGGFAAWTWRTWPSGPAVSAWSLLGGGTAGVLRSLPEFVRTVVAAAALLALVAASTWLVEMLTPPVLRLLEGYWPGWLRRARERLVRRHTRRLGVATARLRALASRDLEILSRAEREERAGLELQLHQLPRLEVDVMPTRLGNIMRASERRPVVRYGLDPVVCWPRLWLVLPSPAREDVSAARRRLDITVQLFTWSLLFALWTIWAWWPLPVGVACAFATYYGTILRAARQFGDAVESCFDLYRRHLYDALRWPQPCTPAEEHGLGRAVTQYLWRGSKAETPRFTAPDAAQQADS